ncbi:MAG: SpoIID/LytB domain-containing protein [Candidatus Zapsychrus exili]|nr:SpoIID/LytB domain-containing protein [Candidatus Zapsychrus exili]
MIRKIITIFILAAIFLHASSLEAKINRGKNVRVAILKGADKIVVSTRLKHKVIDPKTDKILTFGRVLREAVITSLDGNIKIDEAEYKLGHIRISPKKEMSIHVGDKSHRYRGDIDIFLEKDNNLLVVNTLNVERYVKGVLYHEVGDRWPMEALKAQAVAVRTYALYQVKENKDQQYDLRSDIYSQVYGGKNAEKYRTSVATNRTRNEILSYKGEIFPAYYHSNSGGHTEDVSELWEHDLAPLKGVVSEFSKDAPSYKWKKNIRLKDVSDALNKKGYDFGLIKEISILERNKSGRIRELEILTRDGSKIKIKGKDFRDIVGPNKIRSNNYKIKMKGYYADFSGFGWGHGVGLCQWGTHNMARQKYKYKEILEFYYPGTDIVDYKEEGILKD